ncbi:hypothetical protein C8R45DRAFT_960601 [Mycena sanguinolenta]|nr:hypothetical protein C8R45DRAFT_960601 [Mycena sanguinolenta]
MTVVVYQGAGSEQEWRQDIEKYMTVRHPSIVQLYGTATCGTIHAAVFNDDLIPLQQFVDTYRHSHFASLYIDSYINVEFSAVWNYFHGTFQHYLSQRSCTFFIRRTTGQFCADLAPGGPFLRQIPPLRELCSQQGLRFLSEEDTEAIIVDSLTLDQYHEICRWEFSTTRSISIPTSVTVNLDSVLNCPSRGTSDEMVEIAYLPNANLSSEPRWRIIGQWPVSGEVITDGWIRFNSDDVTDRTLSLSLSSPLAECWLSQANYIFKTLQISSNLLDHVVVHRIHFILTILTIKGSIPRGFLFLCPWEEFQTRPSSFKWPDFPAYWSLDPSGVERLTSEDATGLGFPSIRLSTETQAKSWDATVYGGLHRFHQIKGFSPDTQDLARHLGQKLYKLSRPFAQIDDSDDLATTSANQDAEYLPLSSTFRLTIIVKMSLIVFLVLFSVLDQM